MHAVYKKWSQMVGMISKNLFREEITPKIGLKEEDKTGQMEKWGYLKKPGRKSRQNNLTIAGSKEDSVDNRVNF